MSFRTFEVLIVHLEKAGPRPYITRFYADSAQHALKQWRTTVGGCLDQTAVAIRSGLDAPWHFCGAL